MNDSSFNIQSAKIKQRHAKYCLNPVLVSLSIGPHAIQFVFKSWEFTNTGLPTYSKYLRVYIALLVISILIITEHTTHRRVHTI
jgi:hypothetical protein